MSSPSFFDQTTTESKGRVRLVELICGTACLAAFAAQKCDKTLI
jgi:hypothetical protein